MAQLTNVIVTPTMILEYLEMKCREKEEPIYLDEDYPLKKNVCKIMQFQEP